MESTFITYRPLESFEVTSEFGRRVKPSEPATTQLHTGIDLRTITIEPTDGHAPVFNAHNGQVIKCGWSESFGNYIVIKDPVTGRGTLYAHLDEIKFQINETEHLFGKYQNPDGTWHDQENYVIQGRVFLDGVEQLDQTITFTERTQIAIAGSTPNVPPHLHLEVFNINGLEEVRKQTASLSFGFITSEGGGIYLENPRPHLARAFPDEFPLAISTSTGGFDLEDDHRDNSLEGNARDNVLTATLGDDTISAGDGDDILYGGSGDDHLYGGGGNDILNPGAGTDLVSGGSGFDTYRIKISEIGQTTVSDVDKKGKIVLVDDSEVEYPLSGTAAFLADEDGNSVQGKWSMNLDNEEQLVLERFDFSSGFDPSSGTSLKISLSGNPDKSIIISNFDFETEELEQLGIILLPHPPPPLYFLPTTVLPLRDFALLSSHVYEDETSTTELPAGWSQGASSDAMECSKDGYYARAYVNYDTQKIIISHRGTDNIWDKLDDDWFHIYKTKTAPAQAAHASDFIDAVENFYPGYEVVATTGHSLGGVLSELTSCERRIPSISFENPGTLEIIQDMVSKNRLLPDSETYAKANSITFKAAPNAINTVNTQCVKKLYRLYPPFDVAHSGTDFLDALPGTGDTAFTNQQHSMEGILACFDPTTGLPKVYSIVTRWVTDGEAWFRSFTDNPHYWEEYFKSQHFSPQQKLDYIADELSEPTPFMQAATIHVTQLHQKVFGTTLGDDEVVSDYDSVEIYKYGGGDLLKNKNLSFSTLCWESRKIKIQKTA